jgi:hypothetical protein
MAEPLPEPSTPTTSVVPLDDEAVARKNMQWGWALFGLFWVLFGGTIVVALVYLWLS